MPPVNWQLTQFYRKPVSVRPDEMDGRVICRFHPPGEGGKSRDVGTLARVPGVFNQGGGGGVEPNSVAATRQSIEGFLAAAVAAPRPPWRVYVQTVTFPPEATSVAFLQQESYFCCVRAGSDVTGPSSSSGLGQV